MSARIPLDVDVEDKILYGLTPIRLGYVVVALLASFALWSPGWAPAPIRGAASCLVAGIGAAAAWGRWRGRAADEWLVDALRFVVLNYRLELTCLRR